MNVYIVVVDRKNNNSPTDIASDLIHLLGQDKTQSTIPEDRRSHPPAPDHDHDRSPRRSPDPAACDRREQSRDEYDAPRRNRSARAERSGPRDEAGPVSHEPGVVRPALSGG